MSYFPNKKDSATGVSIGIDYAHHEVHDGSSFYYHDVISLGNGANQRYLITTPNTTKWAHFGMEIDFNDGSGLIELYEAANRTGSSLQTSFNRDRNSLTTATTTIDKGTTGGTTDGTRIMWKRVGSGRSSGGSIGTGQERILKQNTKYVLIITNNLTTTNNVSVDLMWYEHTNA